MFSHLMTDVAATRQMEGFEKARIEQVTSEDKAQRQRRLAMPSIDVRALSARVDRIGIGKAAWWVPAGVAVLFLLYAIIGP